MDDGMAIPLSFGGRIGSGETDSYVIRRRSSFILIYNFTLRTTTCFIHICLFLRTASLLVKMSGVLIAPSAACGFAEQVVIWP